MDGKDFWGEVKCFGSVTVGPRGQIVIPANIRKEMAISTGATMLVFVGPGKAGMMLVKGEAVAQMLRAASQHLASIEKVLKGTSNDDTGVDNAK